MALQVGMVGTTGCGKSSFLLVLLRVLEPRGGRVLLNSVDTRDVGLATLREAMGLVPQEPRRSGCLPRAERGRPTRNAQQPGKPKGPAWAGGGGEKRPASKTPAHFGVFGRI